jgi:hypothetical protein
MIFQKFESIIKITKDFYHDAKEDMSNMSSIYAKKFSGFYA